MLKALTVLLTLICANANVYADPWANITALLANASESYGIKNFVVTAGNATGRAFTYESHTTVKTPLLLMSASKFPAAVAIAGAVALGNLTFDTHASEVFPWWSNAASDPRSAVTLRQLLSLTSGFYSPDQAGFVPCMEPGATSTSEQCAEQIYNNASFAFKAGTTFAYNSFHLQIAGAMAAKAQGVTVQELLSTNLLDKAGMKHSGWLGGENPLMAFGLHTIADDYDAFLRAYLAYEVVPKVVADELELDYMAPPYSSNVANSSTGLSEFFGHYSACNWYECLANFSTDVNGTWTQHCIDNKIHMDVGLWGYYPIIDRSQNTYMQIAQAVIACLNCTNPGVDGAIGMREDIKAPLDSIITGGVQVTRRVESAAQRRMVDPPPRQRMSGMHPGWLARFEAELRAL